MNISKPSLKKIFLLLNNPTFKKKPIKTILRVMRWEIVRVRNKPIHFTYDNNLSIILYPDDGSARLVFYFDYQEPHEFEFLDRYLEKDMFCVDIGANIGVYSLFMAKRVKHVIAFEPQDSSMLRFIDNINKNKINNITTEKTALSSKCEKLALKIDKNSAKTYTTSNLNEEDISCIVSSTSLDDYLFQNKIQKIDFIKIDTEGFEQHIVRGAKRSLTKYRPVVQIELIPDLQSRSGNLLLNIKDYFRYLGYTFFFIHPKTSKLVPGDAWNTIAVPYEKVEVIQNKGLLE